MGELEDWQRLTTALRVLSSKDITETHHNYYSILKEINDLKYPINELQNAEVYQVLCEVTNTSVLHNSNSVPLVAQLCYALLVVQINNPPQHIVDKLFHFFTGWLSLSEPPTELLYLLAILKPSHDINQSVCQDVTRMVVDLSIQLEVRRAALHYLIILCECKCEAGSDLILPLKIIIDQLLTETQQCLTDISIAKLILSQLRATCCLVKLATEDILQPLLPSLLAALKFYMISGMSGPLPSISPLPFTATPGAMKVKKKDKRSTTIAGPQSNRLSKQSHCPPRLPSTPTTSDSELSDTEHYDTVINKTMINKLSHQSLISLASVFSMIGPRITFSYWQSFLPDGPRMPHTSPSLLSCALRHSNQKCRSAALGVLYTMIDGSRPYLAAADDHLCNVGLTFTPFSSQLGAILKELHHQLILCLETETNAMVLTRAIRCVAILAINTPYNQLSSGYTTRILSSLYSLSQHRDTDVCVACLTCCGAVLSTSPALSEVTVWLSHHPWLLAYCSAILQPPISTNDPPPALQTEALQVLTAASKFYFSFILDHWEIVTDLCIAQLTTSQQQHSLKLLEEICRASAELPQARLLWQRLLTGPLTMILQSSVCPSVCASACAVLATLSDSTMNQLQPALRMLALTLPLGLSRDESISPIISSSAVRVLGVYCTLPCLREDQAFLHDCEIAILNALASSSQQNRVQASWALANLTDTINTDHKPTSYSQLLSAAQNALKDKDVVKCNAVRALGNLLKSIPKWNEKEVYTLCSELAKCTSSGTMKLRWNACYACYSILSSTSFPTLYQAPTDLLLNVLCETVATSPNFKVCTNASLALGSLSSYSSSQMKQIWTSSLTSLERSLEHEHFTEFKQAINLRYKLCHLLCHLLCVETDLMTIPSSHSLSEPVIICIANCLNEMFNDGSRPILQGTEKKLSSCPTAIQSNPTLEKLYSLLQTSLTQNT